VAKVFLVSAVSSRQQNERKAMIFLDITIVFDVIINTHFQEKCFPDSLLIERKYYSIRLNSNKRILQWKPVRFSGKK
jgi:hypothetical protein